MKASSNSFQMLTFKKNIFPVWNFNFGKGIMERDVHEFWSPREILKELFSKNINKCFWIPRIPSKSKRKLLYKNIFSKFLKEYSEEGSDSLRTKVFPCKMNTFERAIARTTDNFPRQFSLTSFPDTRSVIFPSRWILLPFNNRHESKRKTMEQPYLMRVAPSVPSLIWRKLET